ncbi:MAG: CHAT domain-containing protein [Rhodococcus erythropolis]
MTDLERENGTAEVVIRAADAGDTYISWRWTDDLERPSSARLAADDVLAALNRLDAALMTPLEGESPEQAAIRAMTSGAFSSPDSERELAAELTRCIFPKQLAEELQTRTTAGTRVRIRLTPSPRLARIPWELFLLRDGTRLMRTAHVVHQLPAAVLPHHSLEPVSWTQARDEPAVFVVDPRLPRRAIQLGLRRTLDAFSEEMFKSRIDEYASTGSSPHRRTFVKVGQDVYRGDLSRALQAGTCSRFFYFGHVSAQPGEPGSAALHLSDTAGEVDWGLAEPLRLPNTEGGLRAVHDEDHRPFTALDLLLGTSTRDDKGVPGHVLWPMPNRVAIIACEGGADYRSVETFGLVVAMVNAGAQLVSTTRWALPTDDSFKLTHEQLSDPRPTSTLALTVDAAHAGDHPVDVLSRWQRSQLDRWEETGDMAYTPLVWASLTHTVHSLLAEAMRPDREE